MYACMYMRLNMYMHEEKYLYMYQFCCCCIIVSNGNQTGFVTEHLLMKTLFWFIQHESHDALGNYMV